MLGKSLFILHAPLAIQRYDSTDWSYSNPIAARCEPVKAGWTGQTGSYPVRVYRATAARLRLVSVPNAPVFPLWGGAGVSRSSLSLHIVVAAHKTIVTQNRKQVGKGRTKGRGGEWRMIRSKADVSRATALTGGVDN